MLYDLLMSLSFRALAHFFVLVHFQLLSFESNRSAYFQSTAQEVLFYFSVLLLDRTLTELFKNDIENCFIWSVRLILFRLVEISLAVPSWPSRLRYL